MLRYGLARWIGNTNLHLERGIVKDDSLDHDFLFKQTRVTPEAVGLGLIFCLNAKPRSKVISSVPREMVGAEAPCSLELGTQTDIFCLFINVLTSFRPVLCFSVFQFYRDAKDWWLFGFYFCVPVVFSATFYGLMTNNMLKHQKGSLKISLSEHLKQVHTQTDTSEG